MSFYRATSLLQSESARTRSVVEIVTITKYFRLALVLAVAAIGRELEAQVDLSTAQSDTEEDSAFP